MSSSYEPQLQDGFVPSPEYCGVLKPDTFRALILGLASRRRVDLLDSATRLPDALASCSQIEIFQRNGDYGLRVRDLEASIGRQACGAELVELWPIPGEADTISLRVRGVEEDLVLGDHSIRRVTETPLLAPGFLGAVHAGGELEFARIIWDRGVPSVSPWSWPKLTRTASDPRSRSALTKIRQAVNWAQDVPDEVALVVEVADDLPWWFVIATLIPWVRIQDPSRKLRRRGRSTEAGWVRALLEALSILFQNEFPRQLVQAGSGHELFFRSFAQPVELSQNKEGWSYSFDRPDATGWSPWLVVLVESGNGGEVVLDVEPGRKKGIGVTGRPTVIAEWSERSSVLTIKTRGGRILKAAVYARPSDAA